ncbi:MAG: AAA family ATPase [Patescibacteria group bacterium]
MSRLSLKEVQEAAVLFHRYFDSLKNCFVGRDRIIDLLKAAMTMREHVLIFGPPGTTKTALCDVAFAGITGAEKFHLEFSMFMQEDAIFGPYDTKKMRDEGILEHRTEGMLPEAQFARLGEFLDGSMPLLRSTLAALNERKMRRGRQVIDMPLMTVYCDTNKDPGAYLKQNPYAFAVLDRIAFVAQVGYLSTKEEMTEMFRRFQSGTTKRSPGTLSFDVINELSQLIVLPPSLIGDQMLYIKLGEAAIEYRERRKQLTSNGGLVLPEITDRRFCVSTQMLEVAAVLDGRLEVMPKDLLAVHPVLGSSDPERDLWIEIAKKKIEEIESEKKQQLSSAQVTALEAIMQRAEGLDLRDVQEAKHAYGVLRATLDNVIPENEEVNVRKQKATEQLEAIRLKLSEALLEKEGLSHSGKGTN